MKQTRKKYDAKFKAKVAIEALKERETPKIDDAAIEKQKDRYLRKIGDLEMQLDLPSVSFGVAQHNQSNLCFCIR